MLERVLIVGYGSIGKRHLRIARETLPNADIRVLRYQCTAGTLEDANGSFNQISEACFYRPQAAVIANPAPFHLDVARALADVDTHLLVEKPLSHDARGVRILLQRM